MVDPGDAPVAPERAQPKGQPTLLAVTNESLKRFPCVGFQAHWRRHPLFIAAPFDQASELRPTGCIGLVITNRVGQELFLG
jgi:hypothetical protein